MLDEENQYLRGKLVSGIEREKIRDCDYMLYSPYYTEKKVEEVGEISEIGEKLDEKYRELYMLYRRMTR